METVKVSSTEAFQGSFNNLSASSTSFSSFSCASEASISDFSQLQRSFDSARGRVEASGVAVESHNGRKDDGKKKKKPQARLSFSSSFIGRHTFGNLQSELHQSPKMSRSSSFFFGFDKVRSRKGHSEHATVKLDPIEQSSYAGLEQVAAANIAPARRASMRTSSVFRRLSGSHSKGSARTSSRVQPKSKTSTAVRSDLQDNDEATVSTSVLAYHASKIGRHHADSAVSLCMRRESFQSLKKQLAQSGLVTTQGLHQMLHATSRDGDNFVMNVAAFVEEADV